MIQKLSFEHRGQTYRMEIDDNGDGESSDCVTVFEPGSDAVLFEYDSSDCRCDEEFIAEARAEIDAL